MIAFVALVASALAQPVSEVPPGARAVSVLICTRGDGCPAETRAVAAHVTALGMPLLDFDRLVATGPAGDEARARYARALDALRGGASPESAREARDALAALPFVVPPAELFEIHLHLGDQLLGAGEPSAAAAALSAAAAVSGGRVHDLPPLGPETLPAYLDAVDALHREAPGRLLVRTGPAPATIRLDGTLLPPGSDPQPCPAGWHRVTVERRGRRTAWVGEVHVLPGRTTLLDARDPGDDGVGTLEAAVQGVLRGAAVAETDTAPLVGWARSRDLQWVRFVELVPGAAEPWPAERVVDPDPAGEPWSLRAAWLDVESGRFVEDGPGPGVLVDRPPPDRFQLGVGLGYAHLGGRAHGSLDVDARFRLAEAFALEVRLGILRAGEPYFLYADWVDTHVVPVTVGVRWGQPGGGPTASVSALAVVPYALGGLARGGWDLAPSPWWRLGAEVQAGYTDHGPWLGGSLRLARRY